MRHYQTTVVAFGGGQTSGHIDLVILNYNMIYEHCYVCRYVVSLVVEALITIILKQLLLLSTYVCIKTVL